MTIKELQQMFCNIYERRNRIFLVNGLFGRIMFLNIAIGDLQEAIRKETGQETIAAALARIVARIFCIANYFLDLDLSRAMMQKYPEEHCCYCRKSPCQCPEKRPEPEIKQTISLSQQNWNLKDWCEHLNLLYGTKNNKRGINYILNRLSKEVTELFSLCMGIPNTGHDIEAVEQAFALELADAIAWTMAVANFFQIDLKTAVSERYRNGCSTCQQNGCRCTHFNIQPQKWC